MLTSPLTLSGPDSVGTLLSCQAGLESYSLPLAAVARIARGERLELNPEGESLLGWLPGEDAAEPPVPAWSLTSLLGTPFEVHAATGTVLVFQSAAGPWALVVDRVERGAELAPGALLPLPRWLARPEHSPFAGVVVGEHGLSLLLEPTRLDPRRELPEARMDDEEEALARPAAAPAGPAEPRAGRRRLILFSTSPGGEAPVLFGLSLSQVEEILRPQPLLKVPGAESSFLGLVPWRRQAVPVLDLSLRMGAGPSFFEGQSRFLIARGARTNERLGFAVRPEIRVIDLPVSNQPSQRGRLLDRSLVRGVFELEAGTVFFPDLDRFLAAR